jgi:hypothetical protein
MEITHAALALWIASAMHHLAPERNTDALAHALSETVIAEHASMSGEGMIRVAAIEIAVMFREGSLREHVVGDNGTSFCTGQINLPGDTRTLEGWTGRDLDESVERCVHVTDRMLTASMRACAKLPFEERLAAYVGGWCSGDRSRRISRDRMWLSRRLLEEVPIVVDADGEPEAFDARPE